MFFRLFPNIFYLIQITDGMFWCGSVGTRSSKFPTMTSSTIFFILLIFRYGATVLYGKRKNYGNIKFSTFLICTGRYRHPELSAVQ